MGLAAVMWGSFFDKVHKPYFTMKLHSPELIPNVTCKEPAPCSVFIFAAMDWCRSCVSCGDPMGCNGVCGDPVGCNGVCGDPVGCNGVCGDPVGCNGVCGDPMGCNGVCGDPVGCNGVCGLQHQLPIVQIALLKARVSMKKHNS